MASPAIAQQELVGSTAHVPHAFWNIADGGIAACRVAAFIGAHVHGDGCRRASYVITELATGEHYAIAASYLATLVTPLARRAKIRKMAAPRAK